MHCKIMGSEIPLCRANDLTYAVFKFTIFSDYSNWVHNIHASLQVKVVNIHPDDIVDGNPKITLGLIWIIILHFQVEWECNYFKILPLFLLTRFLLFFRHTWHFLKALFVHLDIRYKSDWPGGWHDTKS